MLRARKQTGIHTGLTWPRPFLLRPLRDVSFGILQHGRMAEEAYLDARFLTILAVSLQKSQNQSQIDICLLRSATLTDLADCVDCWLLVVNFSLSFSVISSENPNGGLSVHVTPPSESRFLVLSTLTLFQLEQCTNSLQY